MKGGSPAFFHGKIGSSVELPSNFQFGTTGSTIPTSITNKFPRGHTHTQAHRHAKETTGTQHTRAGKTRPRWLRAEGYRDRYSGAIKLRPRRLRAEGYRAEGCARRATAWRATLGRTIAPGSLALRSLPLRPRCSGRAGGRFAPRLLLRALFPRGRGFASFPLGLVPPSLSGAPSLRAEGYRVAVKLNIIHP